MISAHLTFGLADHQCSEYEKVKYERELQSNARRLDETSCNLDAGGQSCDEGKWDLSLNVRQYSALMLASF